jgi:hypothetical protein
LGGYYGGGRESGEGRARPDELGGRFVLVPFVGRSYPSSDDRLVRTPHAGSAEDLADALALALRFQGRKRVHNADDLMAEIVAKRLVEHLERAGFVVMKRLPEIGGAALGRGLMANREARVRVTAIGANRKPSRPHW